MKKLIGIALTVALCATVAIVGYNYSVEKETASAALGANVEIKNADFSPEKLESLVKPISYYVQVHVNGKKQSVCFDPESEKIVVQAEMTNEEIDGLYAQFDKKNISIASIDAEFVGIESNIDDNPFIP